MRIPTLTATPARAAARRLAALAALVLAVGVAFVVVTPTTAQAALPALRDSYGPGIDPYATYQAQTTCAASVQPGTLALASVLEASFPRTNPWAYIRACASGAASEHKDGRAVDWMLDSTDPSDSAIADQFIAWLTAGDKYGNKHAMARRLGIMYIIWKGRLMPFWSERDAGTWRTSSGHDDHIHISLGWAGARKQTSYFTTAYALCVPGTESCPVARLAGRDRYSTAVEIGKVSAPEAGTVVIASGEPASLVDGLTGGPLAAAAGAPLLLTRKDALPDVVVAELDRRGATQALVIGGEEVVSADVATQLRELGLTVRRLAGPTRYETAAAVAAEVERRRGAPVPWAVVASGENGHLIDALGGGGLAAVSGGVVLLTRQGELPAATASALSAIGAARVTLVGSQSVVGDDVLAALGTGGRSTERAGGSDRYATAAAVATLAHDVPGADRSSVVIASGMDLNMVDAIPGAALGKPLVLTAPKVLPAATSVWLGERDLIERTIVVGGTGAVSQVVVDEAYLAITG